jgi:hypothetical protein
MKNSISVLTLLSALMSSVSAQDSVQVKTGWNIIGAVKAGVVPDVLTTIPDSILTTVFYGDNPGTCYQSTDTLGKCFGHWVKVNADGIIVFSTVSPIDSCKSKAFIYQGKFYQTDKIGD